MRYIDSPPHNLLAFSVGPGHSPQDASLMVLTPGPGDRAFLTQSHLRKIRGRWILVGRSAAFVFRACEAVPASSHRAPQNRSLRPGQLDNCPAPSAATALDRYNMPAVPFKVKAVFEYNSEEPDDLKFPNGQIITVTDDEDADWYTGEYTLAQRETSWKACSRGTSSRSTSPPFHHVQQGLLEKSRLQNLPQNQLLHRMSLCPRMPRSLSGRQRSSLRSNRQYLARSKKSL